MIPTTLITVITVVICLMYLMSRVRKEVASARAEGELERIVDLNIEKLVPKSEIVRGLSARNGGQGGEVLLAILRGSPDAEIASAAAQDGLSSLQVSVLKASIGAYLGLINVRLKLKGLDPVTYPNEEDVTPKGHAAAKADETTKITCACGKKYSVPRARAAKPMKCPACGQMLKPVRA